MVRHAGLAAWEDRHCRFFFFHSSRHKETDSGRPEHGKDEFEQIATILLRKGKLKSSDVASLFAEDEWPNLVAFLISNQDEWKKQFGADTKTAHYTDGKIVIR